MSEPSMDVIIADYKKENEELVQVNNTLRASLINALDKVNELEDEVGILNEQLAELQWRLESLSK